MKTPPSSQKVLENIRNFLLDKRDGLTFFFLGTKQNIDLAEKKRDGLTFFFLTKQNIDFFSILMFLARLVAKQGDFFFRGVWKKIKEYQEKLD